MRRCFALVLAVSLSIVLPLWVESVSAKNSGGGFRSGNRATRGDDGPGSGWSTDPGSGGDWSSPDSSGPKKMPRPHSWYRTIRNLVFGGVIGSLLFGERFSGFGLFEVVILFDLEYAPIERDLGGGNGVLNSRCHSAHGSAGVLARRGFPDKLRDSSPPGADAQQKGLVESVFICTYSLIRRGWPDCLPCCRTIPSALVPLSNGTPGQGRRSPS